MIFRKNKFLSFFLFPFSKTGFFHLLRTSYVAVEAKSMAILFGVIPVQNHLPAVLLSLPVEPVCRKTAPDEKYKRFEKRSISFNFA